MKEKITKFVRNVNPDLIFAIKGFGFAIAISSIPILIAIVLTCTSFLDDACFWHDGGECPLCGW